MILNKEIVGTALAGALFILSSFAVPAIGATGELTAIPSYKAVEGGAPGNALPGSGGGLSGLLRVESEEDEEGRWRLSSRRIFDAGDLTRWEVTSRARAELADSGEGGGEVLTLTGKLGGKGLISPVLMNLPADVTSLTVDIESAGGGNGTLLLEVMNEMNRIGLDKRLFTVISGGGMRSYTFDLMDLKRVGGRLFRLRLDLRGTESVSLGGIRFNTTSPVERIGALSSEFLRPHVVTAVTIGSVRSPYLGPYPMMLVLYVLLPLLAVLIYLLVLRGAFAKGRASAKGWRRGGGTFKMAALSSILIVSLIFTARMDYNWLIQWRSEMSLLGGRGVSERIDYAFDYMKEDFFNFLEYIDENLPEGATVGPVAKHKSSDYGGLARYYLLPRLTSSSPDYLWAYRDMNLYYDSDTRSLSMDGKVVAEPGTIVPVLQYGLNGYLFRVLSPEEEPGGSRRGSYGEVKG